MRLSEAVLAWASLAGQAVATAATPPHPVPSAATTCLIQATDLRVEGLAQRTPTDLVAVGMATPTLSWMVSLTAAAPSTTKNQTQGGYHIVAVDADTQASLWDSGNVESGDTLEIAWGGTPLQSRQRVAVHVTITDGEGHTDCPASTTLTFETGLLQNADWSAEWIGRDPNLIATDCETFADNSAPRLRLQFDQLATKSIARARVYGTGLGYYKLFLDGTRVGDAALEPSFTAFGTRTHYSVYDVTPHLTASQQRGEPTAMATSSPPRRDFFAADAGGLHGTAVQKPERSQGSSSTSGAGTHVFAAELGNGWWNPAALKFWGHLNWRTGLAAIGVPMVAAQLEITYTDGTVQTVATAANGSAFQWKVGHSPTLFNNVYLGEKYDARLEDTTWLSPGFDDSKWAAPLGYAKAFVTVTPPPPPAPLSAGKGTPFCGESGLNPPPNPGEEAYQTLTLQCNASGATIAQITFAQWGMPTGSCKAGWGPGSCGSVDATTKWAAGVCVGHASCLLDPRTALGDTCPNHFKTFAVTAACTEGDGVAVTHRGAAPSPGPAPPAPPTPPAPAETPGPLQVTPLPPVRPQKAMTPLSVHSSPPLKGDNPGPNNATVTMIDIGENIAGVCRFSFRGASRVAGSTVTVRYGELLRPDGTLNAMTSVAGQIKGGQPAQECPGTNAPAIAYQQDTYIVDGRGEVESWQPSFCWHAFRYAAVATPAGVTPPTADDVTCWPLRTDVPQISEYDTAAQPLLGRITQMTRRTFENNMMSVQSDCPHRERLGYGGDALASGEAGLSIFDWRTFYRKRVVDYSDAQRDNGGFTETAPFVGMGDAGLGDQSGPIGWQTFQPISMLWMYKYYGEVNVLKNNWPALKRFIALLDTNPPGVDGGLGDWMPVEKSQVQMTGEGFRRQSYLAAANISKLLGEPESEQAKYLAKVAAIDANFTARFMQPNGTYVQAGRTATQCGQSMPIFMGMVPTPQRSPALATLVDTVKAANGSMLVGMFGIKWFLMALAENNEVDLAYNSIATTTYPSYGYMLENNATTIWESWFFSDNTFSHDHPMFGSVETFMMQGLGGIQPHPAARGFDRVLIKPRPPTNLGHFGATYLSVRGTIEVTWQWSGESVTGQEDGAGRTRGITLTVTVPPNVVAEIHVPSTPGLGVAEDGAATAVEAASGATATVFARGSGTHVFRSMVHV